MARSMASLYDGHDYYKRMFELQEKLRKSEEERIRLEERFNVLMRDSRNRHDVCINRLRMKYIQYLEEQRTRDERNHKLLSALDRVMNKLALMSAKKDRLNVLRKQYEAYLLRVYANRRPPGSVTGDSGIASQNEDRCTKKTVPMNIPYPDLTSAETRGVSSPRVHPAPPAQLSQPRSIFASKFHDQTGINDVSLNNPAILPITPSGASFDADYHQTNVLRTPHVYVSSIDQSGNQLVHQIPSISVPETHQNLRGNSGFDLESASRNLRNIQNFPSYAAASILSMTPSDQTHPEAVPVNRFFREHEESVQAASGLPGNVRFVGDAARYEPTSRQPDSSTLFQYHDANTLSSPQTRIRQYNLSETAIIRPTSVTAKSNIYQMSPDMNQIADQVVSLPGYMDYTLANPQKSEDEESAPVSFTSDDIDDLMRRNERLLWKDADIAKIPQESPATLGENNANPDENGKTTAILENELDRYISNIRKLHREHGVPSLEELDHEQNTSGDLLNVTLSEDVLELPEVEERVRKERVPEEMNRILALASDLASRTANLKERNGNDESPTEVEDKIRLSKTIRNDASKFEGKREAEGHGTSKNEIRDEVATRSTELEQRGDMQIVKENLNNTNDSAKDSRERDLEVPTMRKDDEKEEISSSNNGLQIDEEKILSEQQFDVVTGEESNVEGLFDVAEELVASWDLASVQKQVRELHLDDSEEDRVIGKKAEKTVEEIASKSLDLPQSVEQSEVNGVMENAHLPQDTLPQPEMEAKRSDASEVNESHGESKKAEDVPSEISNKDRHQELKINDPANIAPQMIEEFGELSESDKSNKQDNKQDNNETTVNLNEPQIDDQPERTEKDNEYNVEEGYVEDPNQMEQYERQDHNEQYHYDQTVSYEGANEEYETYVDQGYAQDNQEYVEYVDGQYEQYSEDPNNQQYQQDPNAQYEQDPNQAYDYNYDPNQEYADDPNQQYDPNQGYGNNPEDQTYDYTQQVPYDPNQTYDNTYEEEHKQEQHNPEDEIVNVETNEEKPKTEEIGALSQADQEMEHKSDADEEEPQQVDVNEGNQSKKKKDVIKSLLDSDTDTTIEKHTVSNTESDFDFN